MSHIKQLRGLAAGVASLSLLTALPAPADPAAVTESEVLVPGSRLDAEALASVTVITAERIAASPAQTVADLLAQEAGVTVRSLYGNYAARATVDVRGFGATGGQNTLILLDGRRLNDVDTATVNFAALQLQNIERIEIVRGAGSVLYGDGATGGSINIVTRRPQSGEKSGRLGISAGSYDTKVLEGQLGIGGERMSLHLAADSIDSDGYRDNNGLKQRTLQAEWRLDSGAAELYAKAGFSDQALGLPGVRTVQRGTALDEISDDPRGTGTPDDFADERIGYLTLGVSRALGEHAGLLIDAGYRDRGQQALFVNNFSYVDTHLETVSLTPRLYVDHTLPLLGGRLLAGIDLYDYDYDSGRAANEASADTPAHRLLVGQRSSALYLNNVSRPADKLSLQLGARLQRVEVDARDVYNPTAPGAFDPAGAPDFARSHTESMFEAAVGYDVTDAARLFVRAGRSVRFATVDDLFGFDEFFAPRFLPLEPQVARHAEMGGRIERGIVDARVSAYLMNLDEEIHFNPVNFANENLDPTRRRGVEAELGLQALENLALRANYTVQRSTFREGAFGGNDIPLAPRRMANVSLLWTVVPDVKLAATWRHVGTKRFENDEANTFGIFIPACDTLDAKLTAHLRGWTFSASVLNALDEKAFDYGVASTFTPGRYNGYPLPERSFSIGVSRGF